MRSDPLRLLLGPAVVLACVARPAAPTSPETTAPVAATPLVPTPTATTPAIIETPAPPVPVTSPTAATPPLDVHTPLPTPFDPAAFVVAFPTPGPATVLFPDELARIRRRVATWLVAHGHAVVPIAELERIEDAALANTLVLEHDRRCVAPLSRDGLRRRNLSAHPHVVVQAECSIEGPCFLQLELQDAAGGTIALHASADVRRPEDPASWVRAVDTLGTARLGSIGLGHIGMSHPPPIMFQAPISIGPWRPEATIEPFTAAEGTAAACAHPELGMTWSMQLAVDRRGKTSRCLAEANNLSARPHDGDCLCRVVSTIDFGKGKAGRRLRIEATDDGELASPRHEPRQAGTEPWVARLRDREVVARCMLTTNMALPAGGLDVALTLAEDGTVDDVHVAGTLTEQGPMRLAACIAGDLRSVPLPCAPPGIRTLQLHVGDG